MTGRHAPVEVRLWEKVQGGSVEECWLWQGALVRGYGELKVAGRPRKAHRLAWEHLRGPIPDGLVIDHLCRTPRCVNPWHLEPVTNLENLLRVMPDRTRCIKGHAFDPTNTHITPKGARRCRRCDRERMAARRAARAVAA